MPSTEPTRISRAGGRPITSWDFGTGAGEPVVLAVHDFTANGLWFGDLADAGAGRFRLVAPDLRGRGGSTGAPAPVALEDHVADLFDLVDLLGVASVSIVGHGTGALVALAATAAAPTLVTRVVLVDGPPSLTTLPVTDWIAAAALVDPGTARLGRTWAHRDEAIAENAASGRLPASGMTRALRRAVDAETAGSGFGWRPRLATATLERDWDLLSAWTPSVVAGVEVVQIAAAHGHRPDDPPIPCRDLAPAARSLDTTHTGLLVEAAAVRAVAASIEESRDTALG